MLTRTLLLFFSVLMLAGCSKAIMPPTPENAEAMVQQMDAAHRKLSVREIENARSNEEARRQNARRVFFEPVADAGYDVNATLSHYARGLLEGTFTPEESQVAGYVLTLYRASADDLMRWGLLRKETHEEMQKVFRQ